MTLNDLIKMNEEIFGYEIKNKSVDELKQKYMTLLFKKYKSRQYRIKRTCQRACLKEIIDAMERGIKGDDLVFGEPSL